MNNIRKQIKTANWKFNKYIFNEDIETFQLNELISEYKKLTLDIINLKSQNKIKWVRSSFDWDISNIVKIKKEIQSQILNYKEFKNKNIIKNTWFKDENIWHWQDSIVYNYNKNYVYKEWKESNELNLEYMQKKYKLLKKYLKNSVPDTHFVLWESVINNKINNQILEKPHLNNNSHTILLTIQRKIKWKNCQQMSLEERNNDTFLNKLEKEHKKYILLKFFIESYINKIWLPKKCFKAQLDLWPLSKKDSFNKNDSDDINNSITSPNIMWDWDNVKFIDLWYWVWDENKEIIFNELIKDETVSKWENILESYHLN